MVYVGAYASDCTGTLSLRSLARSASSLHQPNMIVDPATSHATEETSLNLEVRIPI